MATHTLFYSWQSDVVNSTNRGFIEDCLVRAIKEVRAVEELQLDPCLDRDTNGVPGSPDIASTIFEKIRSADVFIADVSFINQVEISRRTPNPNVLVELGYAAGRLGWEKIVCVFNKATGSVNDLPFDIRPRRVRAYELLEGQDKAEQRKTLVSVLKADITDILNAPDKAEAEALQHMLSLLASDLIPIIVLGDEIEERELSPSFDSLRSQFDSTASSLRHIASTDIAIRSNITDNLESLADVLEKAAHLQMCSGSWPQFEELVTSAVEKAKEIKQSRIDTVPLPDESLSEARNTIVSIQRQLAAFASRADSLASDGRLDDLQSTPSQMGGELLRVGHCNIDGIQIGLAHKIRQIGRDLHLIETIQIYCDGGQSVRRIIDRIRSNAQALSDVVNGIAAST